MNPYTLVTLLSCLAIAIPAFAQQAGSTGNAQTSTPAASAPSASPGQTATGQPPLEETRGDFWQGDEPGALWLVLHPFASKGYVQRQTTPIRERVNELEELTNENGKTIRDIDDRSQHGIQLASTKTTEADQHAVDATGKAQMAQQAASAVTSHVSKVETQVGKVDVYETSGQTVIRFRPGQTALSKQAKNALDEMATPLRDQHGYVVEVEGFSSGTGQQAIAASRRMADSVVRYLVQNHDIPPYRIYVVGMGNAPMAGEEGTSAKRSGGSRVAISVLKNGVEQVASTPRSDATRTPQIKVGSNGPP